ncbi:MAG: retropepsin-like aspartic protease family protein [Maricaulaceae bacterium]
MSTDVFKNVIFVAGLSLAMVWGINNKEMIYEKIGLTVQAGNSQHERAAKARIIKPPNPIPVSNGRMVSIQKSERDGQFWVDSQVNNRPVNFLVDTGASSVALNIEDAERVGVNVKQLNYNVPVATAGGKVMAAYTTLGSVKVGTIDIKNVKALIVPTDMKTSLLGMSYLGQIRKIEVTPHALILNN